MDQGAGAAWARVDTREDLAEALTALRETAGLTVRDLSRVSGVPLATVGGYLSGRHVPPVSASAQVRAILTACGVPSAQEHTAWLETIARVRRRPARRDAVAPPYRGLASFQPEDAAWFFGREELTASILTVVEDPDRFMPVVVVGPSGSGKSSVVRAGLVPAFAASERSRRGADPDEADLPDPAAVVLTPGERPGSALAEALGDGPAPAMVVVDQLEECFTVTEDPDERESLLAGLDRLAGAGVRVVLSLRSDFFTAAMTEPRLVSWLQHAQVVVGPMSEPELRRAILEPARAAGLQVEPGLVDRLLRDLAAPGRHGPGAYEAGALPLMSHALLATWRHGSGSALTLADYVAVGSVEGAVALSAEEVYGSLGPREQELARGLFLRLVTLLDGTVVTRRRITREAESAAEAPGDPASKGMTEVIERFVEARLLTADADTVEIAHEALLEAWPRLHGWVDEDLDTLRLRRRLADAVALWQENGEDAQLLYRGAPLELATSYAEDPGQSGALSADERRFLARSAEQARASRTAEQRRALVLRRLSLALSVVLVAALTLAVVSWRQSRAATSQRNLAVSRQLAMTADRLRSTDVALSRQLAVAAQRTARTPEATAALLSDTALPRVTRLAGASGVLQAVAVNPAGTVAAAVGADHRLRLWSLTSPGTLIGTPLPAGAETLFAVAFSPDGRTVVAGGSDTRLYRWDVTDLARPRASTPVSIGKGTVYALAWSRGAGGLAAAVSDGTLHLWSDLDRPARTVTACAGPAQSVAAHPRLARFAVGCGDGTLRLWDVGAGGTPAPASAPYSTGTAVLYSVAFDPTGTRLAVGGGDRSVHLLDVHDPARIALVREPLTGPDSWVNGVAWSPDGARLAAASSDNHLWSWSTRDWAPEAVLVHPGPVTSVVYLPSGEALVTSSSDGAARVWAQPGPVATAAGANIFAVVPVTSSPAGSVVGTAAKDGIRFWRVVSAGQAAGVRGLGAPVSAPPGSATLTGTLAVSRDGRTIVSGTADGAAHLWALDASYRASLLATLRGGSALVETVTISPDGRLVAVGGDDSVTWLWDISDRSHPRLLRRLTGATGYITQVTFSPDSRTLAAGSIDKSVRLWDVSDPGAPRELGRPLTGPTSYVYSVAFSPDGRTLAVGSDDKTVWLWDLADRAQPRRLAVLTGPDSLVYSVAFDPAGSRLAAGTGAGGAWLWDVTDRGRPHLIGALAGSEQSLFMLTFTDDGRMLAAGGADHRLRLWSTDPSAAAIAACTGVGTSVTPQEWARYAPGIAYRQPCHR